MGFNYKRDIGTQIIQDPESVAEGVAGSLNPHEAYLDFHGTSGAAPPTRDERVGVPRRTGRAGSYFADGYLTE